MSGAADWALTDTIRDRLFKRLSLGEALVDEVRKVADWFHPQSDNIRADLVHGDEEGTRFTGSPTLLITACTPELDTDAEFMCYGSLTDGAPNTIDIYSDQARSVKVASGTAADGGTVTLAPESGFTLAGKIKLGTIAANASFSFKVTPAAVKLVDQEFNGDEEDDGQVEKAYLDAIAAARVDILSAANKLAAAPAFLMRATFRRRLVSRSSESVIIAPGLTRLSTGQVDEKPTGIAEDTRLAMEANSAGSGVMKVGGPTQSTSTALATGTVITFTTITLGQRGVPSRISLVCVKSLDEDGDPEFDVFLDCDDTRRKPGDGLQTQALPNRLRLGVTWKCPEAGIEALLVDYTASVTNTTGTSLSTNAAHWIRPQGLTSELSAQGTLWTFYEASITRMEFYRSEAGRDAQDEADLVTWATVPTSGVNSDFTTEDIGNELQVKFRTGAGTAGALVDGDKGTVSFQAPTSSQPASRATVTIEETVRSSMQLVAWRDGYLGGQPGAAPEQTAGGWEPHVGTSPNIPDSWLRARTLSNHKRVSHRRG